jgi:linoleoyl-CoA desaturase
VSSILPNIRTGTPFHRDLQKRVADYFRATGASRKGDLRLWTKTALMLAWLAGSYLGFLLLAQGTWLTVAFGVSMGLAVAGIGFNVQHDGNHGAYSARPFVNGLAAVSLDLLGGSSYLWRHKHNFFHHAYTNLTRYDDDVDVGPIARLTREQPRYDVHRFQHIYMWILYAGVSAKWQLVDDARQFWTRKINGHSFRAPNRRETALLLSGKLLTLLWIGVIPFASKGLAITLVFFAACHATTGLVSAVVFQLAHCVVEAHEPTVDRSSELDWARWQVESTVNFAPKAAFLTWYFGGLNYQIEHHLFPTVSHVHYPALSEIVRGACADHGIRYVAQPSMAAAIRSHGRWLRILGTS